MRSRKRPDREKERQEKISARLSSMEPKSKQLSRKVNRKYKDTVFRKLFSDKKNLLSLYNALNGKQYTDPDALEIVTLENAIYMEIKNDLAFILDLNLCLWEHQSTYNPNIPLRDLFYIAGEYQRYINEKKITLYSSSIQRIPAPKFVVFYNGKRKLAERMEHRLSDAYADFKGEPALELKVLVLNINEGYNQILMEHCRVLKEYAQYVAKIRKYGRNMKLEEAVERTVNECIREGILEDFLRKNRAEVIGMSIFEYNKEQEEEWLKRAEFEAGKAVGEKRGERRGVRKGQRKERQRILKALQEGNMSKEQIELCKKILFSNTLKN